MEAAHVTGTIAVIRSPHFDRLTPRVSRRGRKRGFAQRIVDKNVNTKNTIKKIKTNHSQY